MVDFSLTSYLTSRGAGTFVYSVAMQSSLDSWGNFACIQCPTILLIPAPPPVISSPPPTPPLPACTSIHCGSTISHAGILPPSNLGFHPVPLPLPYITRPMPITSFHINTTSSGNQQPTPGLLLIAHFGNLLLILAHHQPTSRYSVLHRNMTLGGQPFGLYCTPQEPLRPHDSPYTFLMANVRSKPLPPHFSEKFSNYGAVPMEDLLQLPEKWQLHRMI